MLKQLLEFLLEVEKSKVSVESLNQEAKIEISGRDSTLINDNNTNSGHWFETNDELSDSDAIVV